MTLTRVALPGLAHCGHAGDLCQLCHLLGTACFKQFFHSRQTLRDVAAGDAAGMEGTHGQLGARFADGLCGDDADRLADANLFLEGQVQAVALGADAVAGVAGENAADLGFVDAVLLQQFGVLLIDAWYLYRRALRRSRGRRWAR